MKITDNIYYVGVNDRNKVLFEGLWPLRNGISYNSYLVTGQKIALIDTVDSCFFPYYICKIREIIGSKPIDYLVVNHMEPDHSGSIALVRHYYPNICIVGNKKTLSMLEGYYGEFNNTFCVCEGTELDLGGANFRFVLTPMVHWPETMMTLETKTDSLFSGDAFGCFGALNGGVVDIQLDAIRYKYDMIRYYSNIVSKYGIQVQMALKKIAKVKIKRICSTHGPVWSEKIPQVIDIYNRLSLYQGEKGVCLIYGSMYGNTEHMAESVAEGLINGGLKDFVMHKLGRTEPSYLIADAFIYKGLVLGAPTYNNGIFPLMEDLLAELQGHNLKNRFVGCFGSFSWAGQAVNKLVEFATQSCNELIGEPIELKQGFSKEIADRCYQLGQIMAQKILLQD